jgi:hypothetical protein
MIPPVFHFIRHGAATLAAAFRRSFIRPCVFFSRLPPLLRGTLVARREPAFHTTFMHHSSQKQPSARTIPHD